MDKSWLKEFTAFQPRQHWNGWFAIALFDEGPFAWIKTHVFVPATEKNGVPLAAVEGFANQSEVAWMAGLQGLATPLHHAEPLLIETHAQDLQSEAATWLCTESQTTISGMLAGKPIVLTASRISPQAMPWMHWRGVLEYLSWCTDCTLRWGDEPWHGAGLIEHAHGIHVPVHPASLWNGRWQWDVLWLRGGGRRFRVGLSSRILGMNVLLRAFGDENGVVTPLQGKGIELMSSATGVPDSWQSVLGDLHYTAGRNGKALHPFPSGSFLGFSFSAPEATGIGFSECSGIKALRPKPKMVPEFKPAA